MTFIKSAIDRELPPQSNGQRRDTTGALVSAQDTRGMVLQSNGAAGAEWVEPTGGATGPIRDSYDVPESVYLDVVANMPASGVYLSPSQDPALIGQRILYIDPTASPAGSGANYIFECGPARSLGITPAPLYWFSTVVEHA